MKPPKSLGVFYGSEGLNSSLKVCETIFYLFVYMSGAQDVTGHGCITKWSVLKPQQHF